LFFDKKDLTNGIDWFIPCAMNANFFVQIVTEKIAFIPKPNHVELSGLLMQFAISSFPAFLIIFVAWIMDEGRKIQEEQELTV
jgi:hypothetical protein